MNHYRYKIISPGGRIFSGVIRLPYEEDISVISHLERDGSTVIAVKRLKGLYAVLIRLLTFRMMKGLKRPQQAELMSNMALMLKSGLTLTTALEEAGACTESKQVGADITDMITSIHDGETFSDTVAKYPHIFPKTTIQLVRIGEETGRLGEMLKDSAEHLKRVHQIISDTKQALIYPTTVFMALLGGVIFWFYYVVPKVLELFKEMDVTLPTITQYVMAISYFIRDHIAVMGIGGAGAITLLVLGYKKNRPFRKLIDTILLQLPLTRTIISASSLAFISEYFSLLMRSGIDIMQSLSILSAAVQNTVYQDQILVVREDLSRGEGIAAAFQTADIFPHFVTRMIQIGEMSGTMTEQLDYIAEEYRTKLNILVATLGKIIEPLVLVSAGLILAIIFIALVLPIYDLISKVG